MADVAQDLVSNGDDIQNLKDLLAQMKEDLIDFSKCINEDAQTSNGYMNEILRMLTTGDREVPLVPIEREMTNFNNHRTEYWLRRTEKLTSALSNFEKISQLCNKLMLQNSKKDV